jgi:hypothetical protein
MNWVLRLIALAAIALRLRSSDQPSHGEDAEDLASLHQTLGDAMRDDGTIDYARLNEISEVVDLDDLRRETHRVRPSGF